MRQRTLENLKDQTSQNLIEHKQQKLGKTSVFNEETVHLLADPE